MDKLVKIGNELIELARSADITVLINDTLKKDILNLAGERIIVQRESWETKLKASKRAVGF